MITRKLRRITSIDLKKLTKKHWSHAVFITALLLLTMLVSWWAIFINQAIEESYQIQKSGAMQSLESLALLHGHLSVEPQTGVFSSDDRLESQRPPSREPERRRADGRPRR